MHLIAEGQNSHNIHLNFAPCSHLEYNSLTEVNSGSLYGLTSLQQLFLSNNSIARINPDGWKFCQKLRELWVPASE